MNDVAEDFKQIKISRLTLGLIMSVAVTSGVVVWNAAQVAGRIGDLEHTVQMIQQQDNGADAAVLDRLDNLERQIAGIGPIDTEDIEEDVLDLEEKLEEFIEEMEQQFEERNYELGDIWWRIDVLMQVLRTRAWGDELLDQHFGPQGW
jgi:signal transduction histidine kinase